MSNTVIDFLDVTDKKGRYYQVESLPGEEWRVVPGHEKYRVSNYLRVKCRADRKMYDDTGDRIEEFIMAVNIYRSEYRVSYYVNFWQNWRVIRCNVFRVYMRAFVKSDFLLTKDKKVLIYNGCLENPMEFDPRLLVHGKFTALYKKGILTMREPDRSEHYASMTRRFKRREDKVRSDIDYVIDMHCNALYDLEGIVRQSFKRQGVYMTQMGLTTHMTRIRVELKKLNIVNKLSRFNRAINLWHPIKTGVMHDSDYINKGDFDGKEEWRLLYYPKFFNDGTVYVSNYGRIKEVRPKVGYKFIHRLTKKGWYLLNMTDSLKEKNKGWKSRITIHPTIAVCHSFGYFGHDLKSNNYSEAIAK